MKYKSFLSGMAFLLLTAVLPAQSLDSVRMVALQFQLQQADFAAFNDQARALGYPGLENAILEFGALWQSRNRNWLNSTGAYWGLAREEDSGIAAEFTEYMHLGSSFETSWSPLGSERWFVGPSLAVNPQLSRVILRVQNQVNTLGSALDVEYQKFTRLSVPVEVGLNIQHYLKTGSENVFFFGLRAGYRIDDNDSWRVDGAVPWENSGLNTSGWFAAFRFGAAVQ